jgi:hypothetical protein
MTVRPAAVIPAEDAWAYTPEHRALLAAALEDVRAGRVVQATEDALHVRGGLGEEGAELVGAGGRAGGKGTRRR